MPFYFIRSWSKSGTAMAVVGILVVPALYHDTEYIVIQHNNVILLPMPHCQVHNALLCMLLTVGLVVIVFCALILYFNIGLPNELRGFFFFVQVCTVQDTYHMYSMYSGD